MNVAKWDLFDPFALRARLGWGAKWPQFSYIEGVIHAPLGRAEAAIETEELEARRGAACRSGTKEAFDEAIGGRKKRSL